jgi:hypothetical protein
VFAQFALFLTIGMMLHAYYAVNPVPPMATNDEIFPHSSSEVCRTASPASSSRPSSPRRCRILSGSLNSLASTSILDFYSLAGVRMDDRGLLRLSRWLTAVWGWC